MEKKETEGAPFGIRHIAFIMDGNGRWAKKRLMPREYGHAVGAKKFREIVRYCGDIGIRYVTAYAFSTENWKRPPEEVNAIMRLFGEYLDEAKRDIQKNAICLRFIGNRSVFDEALREKMRELEEITSCFDKTLCIAINYGGRGEIVDAVNALVRMGKRDLSEEDITRAVYSGFMPPPDLIVRTGGEMRLSNFLLWQSAYAELFFTETLWPDFSTAEVAEMIDGYGKRNRRYGGV